MAFEKMTCPYCGNDGCEAEFCDVGVGYVQCGPYHCLSCKATEIGPYDKSTRTVREQELGWYAPHSANLPDTVSTINGQFVSADLALSLYRRGRVDHVPFRLETTPEVFAQMLKDFRLAA